MDFEVTFQPEGTKVKVRRNTSVLEAARRAGVRIPTRCGGKMGCLMCKVQIQDEERNSCLPPKEAERRKLGSLIDSGIRLSCQTVITGDLTVIVPEDPLKAAVRKKLEAARKGQADDFI
ncbi:2Fe-2S iron-sulfur cluster-binding protein [Paenibacillus dakarensis]|uniref:2Fe-2S iron-sulfur cluster-binding protein n=1 Tax=Paenibacillus dakarensis TaxID=1527293 RepID=UPI0006D59754|nr:2Fe-2S iron-sulfur cluster-binding protein [Paenibacillus dakarensis]